MLALREMLSRVVERIEVQIHILKNWLQLQTDKNMKHLLLSKPDDWNPGISISELTTTKERLGQGNKSYCFYSTTFHVSTLNRPSTMALQ